MTEETKEEEEGLKWETKDIFFHLHIINFAETNQYEAQSLKKVYANNEEVVCTVKGLKYLTPFNIPYKFEQAKEIVRLLCQATEGGKEEVEEELDLKFGSSWTPKFISSKHVSPVSKIEAEKEKMQKIINNAIKEGIIR